MKKVIIFFAIVFINVLFAQKNNICIEYSVKIYEEEKLMQTSTEFRELFVNAMANTDNVDFEMIINQSGSKFYEKNVLSSDEMTKLTTLAFSSYTGVVFQFTDSIFRESFSLGSGIMIKEPLKVNWKLHNETKTIDGYLCYKATNINCVDNGHGKIFNHPVTAWYCPKLPYRYGPNGYGNLPGLILELQVRNVVYGAKKIDLNSNLDFDAAFLKNVKKITEEELNKKIREEYEELGRQLDE